MTTISTSTTVGVVLNPASYSNPIVIEAGVTISGTANAVFGNHGASGYFVIQNYGTVAGSSISGKGIYLSPGGSVTNAATASITGNRGVGVYGGAGTVVNDGSIGGTGNKGIGVVLNSGGSVSNAGSIIGFDGVKVLGGIGSVGNNGTIGGDQFGVYLFSGGTLTNSGSASIAGDADGVLISVGAGTVLNDGSISGTAANGVGVQLNTGGALTNTGSASITGVFEGVEMGVYGTVVNYGEVAATGTSGSGVFLNAGGVVSNASSGLIGGAFGVAVVGGGATLANAGAIVSIGTYTRGAGIAGGIAVYARAGGSVTNALSASIAGIIGGVGIAGGDGTVVNQGSITSTGSAGYGVALAAGGTLTNAGTIDATYAVEFGGTDGNLLVLDPGFAISGAVTGSASASNTLELASAASAGVVTGLGTQFTNFGPIVFDNGADWSVTGNTAGLAGIISGFTVGDTIELSGVAATGSSFSGGILTLSETIGFATLEVQGPFALVDFSVTSNGGNTDVTVVPCFAAGTRISSADGEREVETLVPGEVVRLAGGEYAAIKWIGHRHLDCRRHPKPADVWPVRVRAGAFAAGMPHRDLVLSPDHAVFVDDVLIPIRYLINDCSIVQEPVDTVTYYHVELTRHAVMLAEGLPCESYLDTGNRGAFSNGGGAEILHPDFALRVWETQACAELVVDGPKLAAAKRAVLAWAAALGHRVNGDPGLRVVVDGHRLRPRISGNTWRVRLPWNARDVRLACHTWVPARVEPDNNDARSLGVAIANLHFDGIPVAADDPRLGAGWHTEEQQWRWTDGDARLLVAEVRELAFDVVVTGSYWVAPATAEMASAG